MAGISFSGAGAPPLSPLPELPAAEGHGTAAAAADDDDDNTLSPLLDLLERFPDRFAQKVLQHVDPIDRTFLAQAGGSCRAAVAASDLPRMGTREQVLAGRSMWVVTRKLREFSSVERLAWAKASGCPWVPRTCELAVRGAGRLEVLQWAREYNCPWGLLTCAGAASGGHLEVLKWARQHDCPWNGGTAFYAAEGGHLEVLKWAREHDCPWNELTCHCAALEEHLELLRWAREHGYPWSNHMCEFAPGGTLRLRHGCGRNHRNNAANTSQDEKRRDKDR
jgi:hypothetical protein